MSDMMAVSSIGSMVAGGVSSFAQYQKGQTEKAAYDYKAGVDLENAKMASGTSEAKFSELMGKQRSLYAAAGVDVRSGSPLLILAHTAAMAGEENASITQSGNEQAAIDQFYGSMSAYTGTVGGVSSFLNTLARAGLTTAMAKKGDFSPTFAT